MYTITSARNLHGYTGADHLLDNRSIRALVGRQFRSLDRLKSAARKASDSFPVIEFCDSSGNKYQYSGAPKMPGSSAREIIAI